MKKKVSLLLSMAMTASLITAVPANAEMQLESVGVVEELDFENYDVQKITQSGTYFDDKIWAPKIEAGDSMEIVEEADGNKALKLTRILENTKKFSSNFIYVFDKAYTGKVELSFNYKIENSNGGCTSFCGFGSSESEGYTDAVNNRLFKKYWFTRATGTENWGNLDNLGHDWVPMTITVDVANGKYEGETYRYYGKSNQQKQVRHWTFDKVDVPDVKYFTMALIGGESSILLPNPSKDAVYYFDNFKLTYYDFPKMKAESVNDNKEIGLDEAVKVTFNDEIADESLNNEIFSVTADKTAVECEITKSADGKEISIKPKNGWDLGKVYSLKVSKAIKGANSQLKPMDDDFVISFFTEDISGEINIKEDEYFNGEVTPSHTKAPEVTYVYELKTENGEYAAYDLSKIDVIGNYTLKITATKGDKTQVKEISFHVIGKVAPFAENVTITGNMKKGETLTGNYKFVDENGDKEATSTYRWLVSDEENGKYEAIKDATTKTLTVTDELIDKYIKFEVTPVSAVEPANGEAYTSEATAGIFRPVAKDVKLTRKDGKITVSYVFEDLNGDKEGKTRFEWYRQDKKDGEYTKTETKAEKEYTITTDDDNKYISVMVIPVSDVYPEEGKGYRSEAVAANFTPVVTDLKFLGQAKPGQTIGAEYKYFDENGDKEGKSIIKWYVNGRFAKEGTSFTITKSHEGKKLSFSVTPVEAVSGSEGETVMSNEVSVAKSSSVSGGGASGGGSGKRPSVPAKPQVKPDDNKKPENTDSIFADTQNHWANKDIEELYKKGIIKGVTDTEFAPEKTITRAEIAVLLSRALNLKDGEASFDDVTESNWYYKEVSAAAAAGLINGADGKFRADDEITREELCTIIGRIFKDTEYNEDEMKFTDKDEISDWAKAGVMIMSKLGIVNGMDDGTFAPKNSTTRAQAATIINKMLNVKGGSKDEK